MDHSFLHQSTRQLAQLDKLAASQTLLDAQSRVQQQRYKQQQLFLQEQAQTAVQEHIHAQEQLQTSHLQHHLAVSQAAASQCARFGNAPVNGTCVAAGSLRCGGVNGGVGGNVGGNVDGNGAALVNDFIGGSGDYGGGYVDDGDNSRIEEDPAWLFPSFQPVPVPMSFRAQKMMQARSMQ
jgi:hypothetical protein